MKIELKHSAIYDLAILQLRSQGLEVEAIKNHPEGVVEITGQRFAAPKGEGEPYQCEYSWGLDVALLHRDGKVFEAYPSNPETFFHVSGKNLKEAERNAWKFWCKILECPKHDFERGEHKDGHGVCKLCGLFYRFTDPLLPCRGCNAKAYQLFKISDFGSFYCEACWKKEFPEGQKIITRLFPRG